MSFSSMTNFLSGIPGQGWWSVLPGSRVHRGAGPCGVVGWWRPVVFSGSSAGDVVRGGAGDEGRDDGANGGRRGAGLAEGVGAVLVGVGVRGVTGDELLFHDELPFRNSVPRNFLFMLESRPVAKNLSIRCSRLSTRGASLLAAQPLRPARFAII